MLEILLKICALCGFLVFLAYISLVVLSCTSPSAYRFFIFQTIVQMPSMLRPRFDNFPAWGLDPRHVQAENVYVTGQDNHRLGCWILQRRHVNSQPQPQIVTVYVHGVMGNRGKRSRVKFYKFLLFKLGHCVVTFDYRGFGDSDGQPLEDYYLVEDLHSIMKFVQERFPTSTIWLFGHSLGTAVVSLFLSKLLKGWITDVAMPMRVVLGAPMLSLCAVVQSHRFWITPFLASLIQEGLKRYNLCFNHTGQIEELAAKAIRDDFRILILHAEDDFIIPSEHGVDLAKKLSQDCKLNVMFHLMRSEERIGHNKFYVSKQLAGILENFT